MVWSSVGRPLSCRPSRGRMAEASVEGADQACTRSWDHRLEQRPSSSSISRNLNGCQVDLSRVGRIDVELIITSSITSGDEHPPSTPSQRSTCDRLEARVTGPMFESREDGGSNHGDSTREPHQRWSTISYCIFNYSNRSDIVILAVFLSTQDLAEDMIT